jgi:hypothetical protein
MRREQKTVIAFELHWQHVVVKDLVHRRARRQRVGEVCETAERVPHAALNAICEDHELQLSVPSRDGGPIGPVGMWRTSHFTQRPYV